MNTAFNPLIERAEQHKRQAAPYQLATNAVADIITFADLQNCTCGKAPEYIQPHNNPEHGEYSIAISCKTCGIQTAAQHWFVTEPNSAIVALNAAIEIWQNTPAAPTHPNPEDYKLDIEAGGEVSEKGEPKRLVFDLGGSNGLVTSCLIPEKKWAETKQDAARYQYIKNHIYKSALSLAPSDELMSEHFHIQPKMNEMELAIQLLAPGQIHDDGDIRNIALDQTIDASIKQQAAKP